MIRTFIDAGVLIAAARGTDDIARRALALLGEPKREFASSLFLKMEVMPKCLFHSRDIERIFYEQYFTGVSVWADDYQSMTTMAYREAVIHGLAAMDALHVAAAYQVGATELITTEKKDKPIHRVTCCRVLSIHL